MHRLLTFVTFAIFSFAANASDTEDVLALVKEHWEARNANDYQTPYDHLSDQGTLHANSDGSFFYVTDKGTVELATIAFERLISGSKKAAAGKRDHGISHHYTKVASSADDPLTHSGAWNIR